VGECFFWYQPTRVVPDQRPLNGCVCVCVSAQLGCYAGHVQSFIVEAVSIGLMSVSVLALPA